jgi:hypothetical protein
MSKFTYENQGSETMLVYHLDENETLDSFAKGMLQGNEMAGILRPSFTQRDLDQYLKYPVTSKIPLKDYLKGKQDRETMLNLCLSIVSAVHEIEEYMLNEEKLMLDPEYIFVDIRKKEAGLVYLPIDEFTQEISVKDFMLYFLSHTQYRLSENVSYVAKMISFLNRTASWDFDELLRYIRNLINERPEENVSAQNEIPKEVQLEGTPYVQPLQGMNSAVNAGSYENSVADREIPKPADMNPNAVSTDGFNPIAETVSAPKKKGLFGGIKSKKQKESRPVQNTPKISGLPSMDIPGVSAPEVVLNVDEDGKFLPEQGPVEEKKKGGLFSFGKKKKGKSDQAAAEVPMQGMQGMPTAPEPPQRQQIQPAPMIQPSPSAAANTASANYGQYSTPRQQAREGSTVYMGHGSSDDENRTVIMGGGRDYGSTVLLGSGREQQASVSHHVVRISRRRTGQSMVINKDVFRIGSEASFVDFYIGDNPAIGACHADIFEDNGAYYITDRSSVNHTYVNGIMAQPMQAVQLGNGNIITLADEDFDFIIS